MSGVDDFLFGKGKGPGDVPGDVLGALGDFVSHPFPSNKPHDPVSATIAPDEKVKLSALIGKYDDWDKRVAVAVTLAESRGKVDARSPKNRDGSRDHGLMQINDKAHPSYDVARLESDPEYNIAAGHDIWKEAGGFSPWTTYKSGAYLLFMGHDATITVNPRAGTRYEDSPAQTFNSGIDGIAEVISALANPSTWARIGKGALGGGLIVLGVGALVFIVANRVPTPVTKTIKTAKAAATGS